MSLKIVFAGTPNLAAYILESLISTNNLLPCAIYTQPDRPAGRGQKLRQSPVKEIALQHQLPIYQPTTLRDQTIQNEFAALQPDVMIVVGYGAIIPEAVLAIPKYGCINVHVSLLPRWRGAAPIQRAIEAGDRETGITIMQMDPGLDTGPILYQLPCAISQEDTSASVEAALQNLGAKALLCVMQSLDHYLALAKTQSEAEVTYAHKITKAEAEIDWTQPANKIQCKIRAFNPAPGTYTWFAGERIKLFQSCVLDSASQKTPGTIVSSSESELIIATGDKDLAILELQLPGSKRLVCCEVMHSKHQLFSQGKQFSHEN